MLDKVKEFVVESYGKENLHLTRTLYWVKEMEPDASEELLIAACSHDIERALNLESKNKERFNTEEEMEKHQTESGKIIFDFLVKEGYDLEKAKRVQELIAKHEVGGDAEQDMLKDADSLSWLEVSAPKHIGKAIFSREELKKKVAAMHDRISSGKAKDLAVPFYEEALQMLDKA
ncbi:MAG: DUF4202 family protein [Candidatus Pacebacteria bacterium]|nr:DUF4202 family protein [Candidatus Paceibacterota bacterium]